MRSVAYIWFSIFTDYEGESSTLKLTELEEVIWQTYVLRQHRRYDDGNSLDRCLHFLKEHGRYGCCSTFSLSIALVLSFYASIVVIRIAGAHIIRV